MVEQQQHLALHTPVEQEHQATNGTAMLRIAQLAERLSLEQHLQLILQQALRLEHITITV
jgi:hypothetical protein